MNLEVITTLDLASPAGQCRATGVSLGPGRPRAVLAVYAADFDVDPYVEMFFFPTDTLKMVLFTVDGEVLWRRDLGPGVVPGMWFCPFRAFDLDGDGVDEIWFVNNTNPAHPLGLSTYCLERIDARTGETTGQWPWPRVNQQQNLSHMFRNFIVSGRVRGEPVLVTAQGTYGEMNFQGWRPDMTQRWTYTVPADAPGARGSHMVPVVDLNQDGVDELMWGERCIELDTGAELFCADCDTWRGHSDIIQPLWDAQTQRWFIFTARESYPNDGPRLLLFDDQGGRVWSDVDHGHMDMGWVARIGDNKRQIATAIRIGHKTCGPDGRHHYDMDEFSYDALTGQPIDLPFNAYQTKPVDLTGDGYHELVRGISGGNGDVLDHRGNVIGNVGGTVALIGSFCDLPGEQLLTYQGEGTVQIWANRDAANGRAKA